METGGIVRAAAAGLARLLYRVRVEGRENLPATGGVLLVCNHVSYADALLLGASCSRPVRFVAFADLFRVPVLGAILRRAGAIPVSPRRSKEAVERAAACLRAGEVVCIFPEGGLTRDGATHAFQRGFELIARKAAAPVVPVRLGALWGSVFSFEGGRFFWKWPREWPRHVGIAFGAALPPGATADEARRAVLALEEIG